jgi:toxin ParE1/3/4
MSGITANPRLDGMRTWRIEGVENHLVFYCTVGDGIEIIRILHGAREIAAILGELEQ